MSLDILKNLNEPIFYVTNDVGKGIGLENVLPNYHIVCLDDHPLIDILQKSGVSVFCLERALGSKNVIFRSSGIILDHPAVLSFVKEKSRGLKPNILFFKPQRKIEIIAKRKDFNLIGNSVEVSRSFEDKVEFFKLCQKVGLRVPDGEIIKLSESNFGALVKKYGEVLVVQFGRGWAGNSTFFVSTENEWLNLQKRFAQLKVKVGRFVNGKTVLNNAVIFDNCTLVSEPALQIKANKFLTSTQAGTGGRQWPSGLDSDQKEKIKKITFQVADLMRATSYKGFFGLDFLIDKETGEIFLSENNARLTASVPFYTKLELRAGVFPLLGYHLLSFLSGSKVTSVDFEPAVISGGEIIARNTLKTKVKVNGSLATGIYTKNFDFITESYCLDLEGVGNFWLETVAKERIVNPEIEIAKINTFTCVCDDKGNLKKNYFKVIGKIREKLKLEKF